MENIMKSIQIHKIIQVLLLIISLCFIVGCSEKTPTRTKEEIINLENRWMHIVKQCHRIEIGMRASEVKQLLGIPDLDIPLYEPQIYKPKQKGTSWFYMKCPDKNAKRSELEFIVRFDLKKTVIDFYLPSLPVSSQNRESRSEK